MITTNLKIYENCVLKIGFSLQHVTFKAIALTLLNESVKFECISLILSYNFVLFSKKFITNYVQFQRAKRNTFNVRISYYEAQRISFI